MPIPQPFSCRTIVTSMLGGALLCSNLAAVKAAPALASSTSMSTAAKASTGWWPATTEVALAQAGANRAELVKALKEVPKKHREGMQFLVENMSAADATTLSSTFLLTQVATAYEGLDHAPWKKQIPKEVFLNDVLPYASLNEVRDNSIQAIAAQVRPLVAGCKTPGEAAQVLNKQIFPLFKVKYSTERKKPHQSPLESMETGLASCSGLSVLLVDACRIVGIPARVAGTPMWVNGRGNHTWVEIWDGDWKFMGAAEPDEQGLNHGWFTGDAAQCLENDPEHAIYASSFKKTGTTFPMVWDRDDLSVNAVNVTSRYAAKTPIAADKTRVLLKVVGPNGKRIKAPVVVIDPLTKAEVFRGSSKDESFDTNDFLSIQLPHGAKFAAKVEGSNVPAQPFEIGNGVEQLVVLTQTNALQTPQPASTTQSPLQKAVGDYFAATSEQRKAWTFSPELDRELRKDEAGTRQAVWEAYKAAPIHTEEKKDIDAKQVRFNQYTSPYTVKTVGTKPEKGWGLVIAMHGGGGAPKEVNDQQWREMSQHYHDHPELGGYIYLALRAPNDTWNGFYDDYVYPLVANLIKEYTLYQEVDPNKVYIMGYSHGGYGAYAIGPKMPDRFAAIHASAGAATDGETAAKNLRNVQFTAWVGGLDTAYDRLTRNQKFDAELKALRGTRTDIYPGHIDVIPNTQHGSLPDRDMLKEMLPVTRNPVPKELTWLMTDKVITNFYWLQTDTPEKTEEIDASITDNKISVKTDGSPETTVFLDSRLIDFSKPVAIDFNGTQIRRRPVPSLRTLCETMLRSGDPYLAFTAQVDLPKAKPVAPVTDAPKL